MTEKQRAIRNAKRMEDYYAHHEQSKKKQRERIARNKRLHRKRFKDYYYKNREQVLARKKTRNWASGRKSYLKCKYGVSMEWYEQTLKSQGGGCAICGGRENKRNRWGGKNSLLLVDHRKQPFKVRGLLCNRCNTGIGIFRERLEIILSAYEYLKVHSS